MSKPLLQLHFDLSRRVLILAQMFICILAADCILRHYHDYAKLQAWACADRHSLG